MNKIVYAYSDETPDHEYHSQPLEPLQLPTKENGRQNAWKFFVGSAFFSEKGNGEIIYFLINYVIRYLETTDIF